MAASPCRPEACERRNAPLPPGRPTMHRTAVRWISLAALAALGSTLSLLACAPASPAPESGELTGAPESNDTNQDALTGSLSVGETLVATANVNLRTGASTSNSILHVVPNGASVTVVAADPKNGFYNIEHNGSIGWSSGQYLKQASPSGGACSVNGVGGTCIDTGVCAGMSGHVSTPGHCPG